MRSYHTRGWLWLCGLAVLVLTGSVALAAGPPISAVTLNPIQVTESIQVSDTAVLVPAPRLMRTDSVAIRDDVVILTSIKITTPSPLPDGTVGAPYAQVQLAATGGSGGYSWSLAPGSTLPAGLTLSSAGRIDGTPTTAGVFHFSLVCTSGSNPSATAPFDLTIKNPAPVLTSLAPTSATAGDTGVTLTLSGTGFVAGSQVQWVSGSTTKSLTPATSHGTQLTVALEDQLLAAPGQANVSVSNPAPGGGTSAVLAFTIQPRDTSPPVILPTLAPLPNTSGWNKDDVTVTWAVSDPESGIATSSGCSQTVVTQQGTTTLTCSATNGAGLPADKSVTVNLDKTAPTISPTITGTHGSSGWYTGNVSVSLVASDNSGGSGVQSVTYSATGAQPINTTTDSHATVTIAVSTSGKTTLSFSATDVAGNVGSPQTVVVSIDKTPPTTALTLSPGAHPSWLPLLSVDATATFKSTNGSTLGTTTIQCFDTAGLVAKLKATDESGGSGVASVTYAATGAQTIPSTVVTGSSAQPGMTTAGRSVLTYFATDTAGNAEIAHSETIVVGTGDDGTGFSCAMPTPAFAIPTHGLVAVNGTATLGRLHLHFERTIRY